MTLQREKQQLMHESEKMKDTETKMAEIAKELQRKEEEHKEMVKTLIKQEEELKHQRDQLKLQQKKVEELVEDNEKKLELVEKNITEKGEDKIFNSSAYLKLKEIISKYKWDLTERLNALEKLVQNTDQLLDRTEHVIVGMEKKKDTENHMEEE